MLGLRLPQVSAGSPSSSSSSWPLLSGHAKMVRVRWRPCILPQGSEAMVAMPCARNGPQTREKKVEAKEKQVFDLLRAAAVAVEERDYGGIAFYAGLAVGALFFADVALNTLDTLPFIPQLMQTVGLAYALLLSCWTLKGKHVESLPVSPLKTIIELMDSGNDTRHLLLQDMEVESSIVIDNGSENHFGLLNEMKVMQRVNANCAQALAEKEALEAVAIQLAVERDESVSKASALKQAMDSMTDRMHAIDNMLNQEIQQLKQHNLALESVALQMAVERDDALKTIEELQKHISLNSYSTEAVAASSQFTNGRNPVSFEVDEHHSLQLKL